MADLKLNELNDLEISPDGDLIIITGQEAIGQSVKIALLTHFGESVYARNLGTPWRESIFIANSEFYQDTIEIILKTIIENVPGVTGVEDFFFTSFDTEESSMGINMTVGTIEGNVDFTGKNQILILNKN